MCVSVLGKSPLASAIPHVHSFAKGNSKQLFYTSIEFSVASLYYTTIFIDYVQGHLIFLVVTLFYRRELFASLGSISFDKKYSTFIDPIGMYCCRFIFHNK